MLTVEVLQDVNAQLAAVGSDPTQQDLGVKFDSFYASMEVETIDPPKYLVIPAGDLNVHAPEGVGIAGFIPILGQDDRLNGVAPVVFEGESFEDKGKMWGLDDERYVILRNILKRLHMEVDLPSKPSDYPYGPYRRAREEVVTVTYTEPIMRTADGDTAFTNLFPLPRLPRPFRR